jgi:RNA recognition motif-containing protein
MNLFVANISRTVNEDALRALFEKIGEVTSAKIVIDKQTGNSKGFGFVEMPDDKQASDAITQLTDADFFGRKLVVTKARPKTAAL